jgi:hypothetical protein
MNSFYKELKNVKYDNYGIRVYDKDRILIIYSNTWNRYSLMGHENGYSIQLSYILNKIYSSF